MFGYVIPNQAALSPECAAREPRTASTAGSAAASASLHGHAGVRLTLSYDFCLFWTCCFAGLIRGRERLWDRLGAR